LIDLSEPQNDFTEDQDWPSLNKKMQIYKALGRKLVKSFDIAKGFDYTAPSVKHKSSSIGNINEIKMTFNYRDNSK
jgi:hypothetical protein